MAALTKDQAEEIIRLKAGSGRMSAKGIAELTGKHRASGENYSTEAVGKVIDIARAIVAGVKLYYLRVETPLVQAVLAVLRSGNRA